MRGLGLGLGLTRSVPTIPEPEPEPIFDVTDLSGWTKTNTTAALTGENDPERGAASTSILETTADATHYISRNFSLVQSQVYRVRAVLKANGRSKISLYVQSATKYWMGDIGSTVGNLVLNVSAPTVTDLGGGWYAMEWTYTNGDATGNSNLRIGLSLTPLDTSYPGDITKGILVGSYKIFEE